MTPLFAKFVVKRAAGVASIALRPITARLSPSVSVLTYHRVADYTVPERSIDAWNVTPDAFARQVAALAGQVDWVFAREVPGRLRQMNASRPAVCLTFDDGFRSVYDEVLPVLRRYHAKATAFVVTAFVGSREPMPFDRWGTRHVSDAPARAWQPLTWSQIEACLATGLVEIGAHSHQHLKPALCSPDELADEAGQSRVMLVGRLGADEGQSYAYPYGSRRLGDVTAEYKRLVQTAGYRVAVSTNLGLARPSDDPYELPRIEVSSADGPSIVRAKVAGSLRPYALTDRLRRARR